MRDVGSRARILAAVARQRFSNHEEVDDVRVLERVRARLRRVCSHPHAIDVYVEEGEVTLIGPVLAEEVHLLLTTAASVRGVHAVVNELEARESTRDLPALRSDGGLADFARLSATWSASRGVLVGAAALAAGGLALAYARR
jgi:hypothetical protein